uniref:Capsid protein n=1 Tax=Red panda feces-associated gemycircularvirus TaxID=2864013 RepID=A0A8K1HHT4_9VIRU|nr:capsid protein [Red panda feces-associated gemycircularvirus]
MAYRKPRYTRKPRTTRRKSVTKRRYARKTTTRRRPLMTKKRLLNVTSTKKRNTMLQLANTSTANPNSSVPIGPGPYLVNASNGNNISVFCPTAMDLTSNTGGANTIVQQAARTATTCYIKGFSEKIRIQTSSGIPWFWRRIVFRSRSGIFSLFAPADTPVQNNSGSVSYTETSNGMQRLYFNQTINGANTTIFNIHDALFRGTVNADWVDPQTAAVDTTRVDLVSDKRMTIRSGNQAGTVKDITLYHPYNQNLVYDDDENGQNETTAYTSVKDKRGGGDMFIYDLFTAGTGAGTSDVLQLTSTSTLYWHEK